MDDDPIDVQLRIAANINALAAIIFTNNAEVGWWDDSTRMIAEQVTETSRSIPDKYLIPTKIALMHSELSEALEGFRKNLMDDHLPKRPMIEVELADTIIRILDTCGYLKLDIGGAIMDKLAYNATREDHKREARQAAGGKSV